MSHDPSPALPDDDDDSMDTAPIVNAEPIRGAASITDAATGPVTGAPIDAGTPPLLDAAMVSSETDAGSSHDQFAAMYELIGTHCVGCHGAGKSLDLSTPALAHGELVGIAAEYKACAATDGGIAPIRVIPGSPDTSLLIQKLEGRQTCGKSMPAMLLPAESVAVFRAWVAAGAPTP